jgi:cytochrome P450
METAHVLAPTPVDDALPPAAAGASFYISDAELDERPHHYVEQLRRQTPVWRRPLGRPDSPISIYTIFPHDLAEGMFKDPRIRQFESEILLARGVTSGPLLELYSNGMLAANGETHRRRRQPLARAFAHGVIQALQPEIRKVVRDVLRAQSEAGQINIKDDFARILPPALLCHIMGIEMTDIDKFVGWIEGASLGLSAFSPSMIPQIQEATAELLDYTKGLLARRRETPGDDFITRYLQSVDEREDYSAEETYVQIAGLILAAAETSRVSITIAMSLLLEHGEAWEAVKSDSNQATNAVAESMRFEPGAGTVPRFVVEDMEIGGIAVPQGSILSASLLGALRDPTKFSRPKVFDIFRSDLPSRHLAFGGGPHRCMGEALGWLEVIESVLAFADMFPNARLLEGPARVTGFSGIRRVSSCPLDLCSD